MTPVAMRAESGGCVMKEYLLELDKLSLRDAGFELDGLRLWQLKELCAHLKIDTRYEGRERKPKSVLVAAVYDSIRQRRVAQMQGF